MNVQIQSTPANQVTQNTNYNLSHMKLISKSGTPPYVVPHSVGGGWEGDGVPPARGWHATKLHQQHRSTI